MHPSCCIVPCWSCVGYIETGLGEGRRRETQAWKKVYGKRSERREKGDPMKNGVEEGERMERVQAHMCCHNTSLSVMEK